MSMYKFVLINISRQFYTNDFKTYQNGYYIVAIVVKGYNGANKIENGSLTREIYKFEENIISI